MSELVDKRLRLRYGCSSQHGRPKDTPVSTRSSAFRMPPGRVAERLVAEHSRDPDWLDEFSVALDRRRQGKALERILEVWGLSQSEAGRLLGVTRQAVAKWISTGIPVDRVQSVASLAAATDLLVHHLKRDRISAVVRRPATSLANQSLIDLLADERYQDILDACREMFDFAAANE